jgi:exonuclease SbcC
MELKKLVLKNFRSHKNLTLNFNDGVTAILGGNGTGKSSIVEAIMFLLTGEGYAKTKQDMLTVGEVSGYAIGHWLIDDKEAILERHLDSSKVAFKYDGTVYKKSTEVSEIWDKLFQIDKHIVQNVIISNQGEIALLFNGDQAAKEKLFQKIFMVPNTTKLRDTIWNSYIKTAPPEYPVKNSEELKSDLQCLEQVISMKQDEKDQLVYSEEAYKALLLRENFLSAVKNAESEKNRIQQQILDVNAEQEQLQTQIDQLSEKMLMFDVDEYRKENIRLTAVKPNYDNQQKALASLEKLKEPDAAQVDPDYYQQLQEKHNQLQAEVNVQKAKIKSLNSKLDEYKQTGLGSGVCPTCGSKVDDVVKLIDHVSQELAPLHQECIERINLVFQLKEELDSLGQTVKLWDDYRNAQTKYTALLEAYKDVDYDPEHHKMCASVVAKAADYENRLKTLKDQQEVLKQKQSTLTLNLAGVAQYDKDPSEFNDEVAHVASGLDFYRKNQEKIRAIEIELAAKRQEQKQIQRDIQDNDDHLEKNKKRSLYVDALNQVYELFHTTKFPRSLINTYSSTVTDYMNEVLAMFDFPYTAKVNESFGIDVFNEEGHKLPSVSGGQQVMVGFSLRLALHNMFVGAFPFMIVDEGSYGLNSENSKKYFEIISKLNKTSKFKQVIVIDHHPELSEYVDNTINL